MDYIHFYPVKHGYVTKAADWPHASIHRFIKEGIVDESGGADEKALEEGSFGE